MIYLECEIPHDKGYLLPLGDLHFSDKAFKAYSYRKLKGYIKWVKETPEARVVLGGDLFNSASRQSKTSPFEQRMSVNEELNEIVALLTPIKKQIAGVINGNHEHRLRDMFDIDLTEVLCAKLDAPYMGTSGVINFKVKKKRTNTPGGKWCQNYYGYFHHGTGGGQSIGGPLNRVEKLANIIEGVDFHCMFHTHKLSQAKIDIFKPNPDAKRVDKRTVNFITCGSYLQYEDSYAERGMLRPAKLGSPRIRLDSNKKRVHVSM